MIFGRKQEKTTKIFKTGNVLAAILLFCMLVSGAAILHAQMESYKQQKSQENLRQRAFSENPALSEVSEPPSETESASETTFAAAKRTEQVPDDPSPVDFKALWAVNPDVVGWIRIPETKVDYPILYDAEDNEKYLHTDFNGNKSAYGAIYLDCDSQPDFTGWNHPIYGHHMKDGSMFKDVAKFKDPEYFKEHQYFEIYTPKRTIHLKAVSCYYTDSNGIARKTGFESQESFDDWLKERLEPCPYAELPESPVSSVFTLATCSYEMEDARTLLFAVEVDEKGNVIPAEK